MTSKSELQKTCTQVSLRYWYDVLGGFSNPRCFRICFGSGFTHWVWKK